MRASLILSATSHNIDANFTSQLIPIRGKPAIGWIIEANITDSVTIVLDVNNQKTINYIKKNYPFVKIALIDSNKELKKENGFTILDSLYYGLNNLPLIPPFIISDLVIVLGDTLCLNLPKIEGNAILTTNNALSSERWCLVDTDEKGFVTQFQDKLYISTNNLKKKKIIVGQYYITDIEKLKNITKNAIAKKQKQLSDVLAEYKNAYKIKTIDAPIWYDFGHKSGLTQAQNSLFNSRDFNNISSDITSGTITKSSTRKEKISDEYAWFINLPKALQILTPRILSYKEHENFSELTMEMYGYPSLSEQFILGNLNIEELDLIIEKLFEVHKLFERYKGNLNIEYFYDLYLHKTWDRIADLKKQNQYWEKIWNFSEIIINGQSYKNISHFKNKINNSIKNLLKNIHITIMHGDYCFSNILFDMNSFICRLIDPRGRIHDQTIYGDPRYDIAKLRHSVVGGYDFIVHGLFNLNEKENFFEIKKTQPYFQSQLTQIFDEYTIKYGYNLDEIKLIEALLFTSMIPLHKDNIQRQKVFYLTAVEKINNIFKE